MKRILLVGQTPPPYGGQAIMIDYMLKADYRDIKFYHVRMFFSKEMDERGKISFYKIIHIFSIIFQVYYIKFKYHTDILYYPPSNLPRICVYRDAIILFFIRFLFKKTIFHFHAAGISEGFPKLNFLEKKIIYWILKNPDLAITSSKFNPADGEFFNAKKTLIIPLGIPDENKYPKSKNLDLKTLNILFMGLMNSTKGEGYVLEALRILKKKRYNIKLFLAGKFESEEYKNYFFNKVREYSLTDYIEYKGVVIGADKIDLFLESDIFCFPSFFSCESFGIVLLEAMQFQLPLIATRWRGIQSIVKENINGFLVDIKSAEQIAEAIEFFIVNRDKLVEFGKESRKIYLENYTIDNYLFQLEKAIINI
jgi:glycosyltransferase involved in cell wall biosynthesis